jgi:hypothetical protein
MTNLDGRTERVGAIVESNTTICPNDVVTTASLGEALRDTFLTRWSRRTVSKKFQFFCEGGWFGGPQQKKCSHWLDCG